MKRLAFAISAPPVLLAACLTAACAYHSPSAPSVVPAPPSAAMVPVSAPPALVLPAAGMTLDVRVSPVSVGKGESVSMTALPTGGGRAPYRFAWAFGDGSLAETSTASTAHAYGQAGLKEGRLTVTDPDGLSASVPWFVTVKADPVVSVPPVPVPVPMPPPLPAPVPFLQAVLGCVPPLVHTAAPIPCNVSVYWNAVPLESALVQGVAWDWGDGQTSQAGVSSSHLYANPGGYNVLATVTATVPGVGTKAALGFASLVVP